MFQTFRGHRSHQLIWICSRNVDWRTSSPWSGTQQLPLLETLVLINFHHKKKLSWHRLYCIKICHIVYLQLRFNESKAACSTVIHTWSIPALLCSIPAQWLLVGRWLHISAGVSLRRTKDGSYTLLLRLAWVCSEACFGAGLSTHGEKTETEDIFYSQLIN